MTNPGLIAIHDPDWEKCLIIKETQLEDIINYLNSKKVNITPRNGYKYISQFAVGVVDLTDKRKDYEEHILPFQDLIPIPQDIHPEKYKKAFTCIKSCRISFIDFTDFPDGEQRYVMVFQDIDTQFTILRPLKSLDSSEIYSNLIEIFSLIGVPSIIISSAKSTIEPILQSLNNFCENFNPKLELPQIEDQQDDDIQHLKNSIQDWMNTNNSSEWHNGLHIIQFRRNCDFNSSVKASPFDLLFKPNYEYVKRRFTRYLLHKPTLLANNTTDKETETSFTDISPKADTVKDELTPEKNIIPITESQSDKYDDGLDEFYLAVETCDNNNDVKPHDADSLIHIFENINRYELSEKGMDPIVDAIDRKHIVVYKKNKNHLGKEPENLLKLEPVPLSKSNNKTDWVCKIREVNFLNNTEYTGSNDEYDTNESQQINVGDQYDASKSVPVSLEDQDYFYTPKESQEENNLEKTIRNELRNVPLNTATTICLVCRKRKRTSSQGLNKRKIGKPVRLRTSIIDRQRGQPNFILAVIVDATPNGEYRLGTPSGVLRDLYSSDQIMECNHRGFTLDDVPTNKLIDLNDALKEQMKITELIKCNCRKNHGYCNPRFSYHDRCIYYARNSTAIQNGKIK